MLCRSTGFRGTRIQTSFDAGQCVRPAYLVDRSCDFSERIVLDWVDLDGPSDLVSDDDHRTKAKPRAGSTVRYPRSCRMERELR